MREGKLISALIELMIDIAGELAEHFMPTSEWKLEKHIIRLKEEAWFSELLMDYKYEYIIRQNRKVRRFLCSGKNIKMILSMDEEREKFINLVKEEHVQFTRLR